MVPPDPPEHRLTEADSPVLDAVVAEYTRLLRDGASPRIEDFQRQHPHLREPIAELLESVALIEQLKVDRAASSTSSGRRLDQALELKQIGSYRIVREIGRGGMGVVFEAIHESLGRHVALKVMPTPLLDGDSYIRRFRREARAAARLHHTNIVSVFGVGQEANFHYYVMDLVDGQSLSEVIRHLSSSQGQGAPPTRTLDTTQLDWPSAEAAAVDEFRLAAPGRASAAGEIPRPGTPAYFRWAAALGVRIADALAYAHGNGILHRDLKPANLLLDSAGVVWMTDFGLAKETEPDQALTRTGDVLGTPQYLAPESLEGRYDGQSEIYCLGLTLFELVTLTPAYKPGSPAEMLRQIATSSPPAPRRRLPQVPRDLSTIIAKCLARDPWQRYDSAEQLRNDLQAFVEDRPISARRPTLLESTRRLARQNPVVAGLSLLSASLVTLVAIVASVGYVSTTSALNREAEKSTRLLAQQLTSQRLQREAETNLAQMQLEYARAEANVALTIEAFDELFAQLIGDPQFSTTDFDVGGFREIAGIEAQVTPEDAQLLENLLRYYEQFARLNEDNAQLKQEAARAYRRVANLQQWVGKMPQAIDAYEKALELFQPLWAAGEDPRAALLEEVRLLNELGSALGKDGQAQKSYARNREAIERLQGSPLSRSDPEVRLELARALITTGFNLFRFASLAPARRDLDPRGRWTPPARPARSAWGELVRGGPAGVQRRNRELIRQAMVIIDELLQDDPDNLDYRLVRATCNSLLAASWMPGSRRMANGLRENAVEEFGELVEANPQNWEARYLLALACAVHGTPVERRDVQLLEQGLGQAEALVDQFPRRREYRWLATGLRMKFNAAQRQMLAAEAAGAR